MWNLSVKDTVLQTIVYNSILFINEQIRSSWQLLLVITKYNFQ